MVRPGPAGFGTPGHGMAWALYGAKTMSGSNVSYLTRMVRSDDLGSALRSEFSVPGMPGLAIVNVQYEGGISEETISLNGIRYMTIAEAAAAWRLKRQRDILHDVVGNALHQLMLGDEPMDWESMPDATKQGWIAGAEDFLQKLSGLGMRVTKQPMGD